MWACLGYYSVSPLVTVGGEIRDSSQKEGPWPAVRKRSRGEEGLSVILFIFGGCIRSALAQ